MGCCGYSQTIDEINQRNKIQPQQQQTTLLYRNDYCYDEEDIEKIKQICKHRPFQNNDVIYYKASININKDYTYYNEYYTIRTIKQNGLEYKSFFKVASPSIQGNIESFTLKKNNKLLFKSKEQIFISKTREFVPFANYELEPNESSLVTFELEAKVKTDIYLGVTKVAYKYIKCFSKYNIKS